MAWGTAGCEQWVTFYMYLYSGHVLMSCFSIAWRFDLSQAGLEKDTRIPPPSLAYALDERLHRSI